MNQAQILHCPTCGAPLDLTGKGAVRVCAYCHNSIVLPESIQRREFAELDLSEHALTLLGDLTLMLANERKIEAIRLLRVSTNLSLRDAKEAVDALEVGDQSPVVSALKLPMKGEAADIPAQIKIIIDRRPLSEEVIKTGRRTALGVGFVFLAVLVIFGGLGVWVLREVSGAGWGKSIVQTELSFGSVGLGPGQFTDPRAVAVDRSGNIYAADYQTGRIQSFDSEGTFRWVINLGNRIIIQSMAVGPDEVLFAVVQGRLRRFETEAGRELEAYGREISRDFYADDVWIAPDGRIGLISRGENIILLDRDLNTLIEIENAVSSVTGDSELSSEIAIDAMGNIFVLGSFNKKVLKYSPEGRYLTQFGGPTVDEVDGKFRATQDLGVDHQGRVYVSDTFGVHVFDNEGAFISRFKLNRSPRGMIFDLNDRLYATTLEPKLLRLKLNY
jgi:DNA-binding beta-propeller fold protein YncE